MEMHDQAGTTPARSEPSSESAVVDVGLESCSLNGAKGCSIAGLCATSATSATAELAMSARIDRPHDVALEYNRSALLRWAVVLAVMAAPLLYFTPVVGVLVCPSAALVAFWSSQRARFVHGGDMRACVNRDCSVVVGIVFISIALVINVFNVGDLMLESDKTKAVAAKSGAINAATVRPPPSTTTTTTVAAGGVAAATTATTQAEDFGHTLPPEILYAHKHEIASQSASLRRAELILNSVLFIPALVTLRHLVRVSKLTHSSSADEGD